MNFSNRRYAWGAFILACIICGIACFLLFKGNNNQPAADEVYSAEEGADYEEEVVADPVPPSSPPPPPPPPSSAPPAAPPSTPQISYQVGGVAPVVYWDSGYYDPYYGPHDWWWRYKTYGRPGDPWWKWYDKRDASPHHDRRSHRG